MSLSDSLIIHEEHAEDVDSAEASRVLASAEQAEARVLERCRTQAIVFEDEAIRAWRRASMKFYGFSGSDQHNFSLTKTQRGSRHLLQDIVFGSLTDLQGRLSHVWILQA